MLSRLYPASTVRQGRPGAIVLLVAMLILPLLAGAVLPAPRPALAATATTTTTLNLRSGPGTSYGVLTVMPAGAAVSVDGDPRNGFYPVVYAGTSGWAAGSFLALGGDGGAPSGTATTTTSLNLRAGAGTGYGVITAMPAGATVTLTGQQANGFVSLTYQGTAGWAASQYLTTGSASDGGSGGDPERSPSPTGTATTTTSLNLRAGAGTRHGVITVMPAGATVTLTGQQAEGFVAVTYQGMAGWAASQYLAAGAPSGGDDSTDTGSSGACADPEERTFLGLINNYRAANGLPGLQLSESLSGAADYHSVDMAHKDYFSHTLANGVTWGQNIANHGYTYDTYQGENIASGNESASATFDQWRNSPGHNANMLNPNFTAIGIGRAYNGNATYDWYWTTTFGGYVDAVLAC
ncbi:MAG: SH3 domain-containing protein [Chloroflexota bacterium]|nr:SH3 domain-containing protein [Chloroflexota bacterium]